MKHLITSLFLIGSLFSAYAQNDSLNTIHVMRDSTPVTNNSNPMTSNNTIRSDSTGNVNNSMRSDSMANMNNTMKSDSTATMNNNMKSDSTGSVNSNSTNTQNNINSSTNTNNQMNSSNANANSGISLAYPTTMSNSRNIQGQPGYVSLPILENYVPDAVVAKVKSKYTSVYDITSVKHTADQTQTTYAVRFGDNGEYKTEIINEDGNTVQ